MEIGGIGKPEGFDLRWVGTEWAIMNGGVGRVKNGIRKVRKKSPAELVSSRQSARKVKCFVDTECRISENGVVNA